MICLRCGIDHDGPEALKKLSDASRAETKESWEIHAMLLRGEDDGRRSSISASLRVGTAMKCILSNFDIRPRRTSWEAILEDEGF